MHRTTRIIAIGLTCLLAASAGAAAAEAPDAQPAKASKGAPLPFHCIEGYSGGAITPLAYLCNPTCRFDNCHWLGGPSVAYSFVNIGSKELNVVSITQCLFGRIEIGYAYNNLTAGSLYDDVRKAGLDMGDSAIGLHHFNLRGMLIEENSFDLPLPAVTAGAHFKYNDSINTINNNLGGAFTSIGYDDDFAVDWTLTATKMLTEPIFDRPVIVTVGGRLSKAAQLGFLGFGTECTASVEGNVVYLPIDQLALGYEFRMKNNPYEQIAGLVEDEDNWHAFSASWVANEHLTITGVMGMFGHIANANADCSLGLQVKYEF